MRLRTKITEMAHEQGMSAAELARQIGTFRSNLSLIDAGKRPVSLRLLERIAGLMNLSPLDLLERKSDSAPVFQNRKRMKRLADYDDAIPDGMEKGWVHAVMLAWQNHYRKK